MLNNRFKKVSLSVPEMLQQFSMEICELYVLNKYTNS